MSYREDLPQDTSSYGTVSVLFAAVVGIALAALSWYVAAGFAISIEELYRIGPTFEASGAGVGADWVTGNTIPWLDFLVALIHAADVLMGVFILLMVLIHWGAFRRLASRMRDPDEEIEGTAVADGGQDVERGAGGIESGDDAGGDGTDPEAMDRDGGEPG
jgi:hypothetical protein